MGENTFSFDEILGDGNMKAMMIQAVAEMLDRRSDIEEVRDHYLGITGQPDLTVIPKPTQEMKLYCPLEIQAESQYVQIKNDDGFELISTNGVMIEKIADEEYGEELMKIYFQLQEQTEDEDMDETEDMDMTM